MNPNPPQYAILPTNDTITFGIQYSLVNIGHMPAFMTDVAFDFFPVIVPQRPDVSQLTDKARATQQATCQKIRFDSTKTKTVFPGPLLPAVNFTGFVLQKDFPQLRATWVGAVVVSACVGYDLTPDGHGPHEYTSESIGIFSGSFNPSAPVNQLLSTALGNLAPGGHNIPLSDVQALPLIEASPLPIKR
jgi:hypothetical protein